MIAAPILLAVAAFIAHKPIAVTCDVSAVASPEPGYMVEGWTTPSGDTIYLSPALCLAVVLAPPGTLAFAESVAVLIHESTHAGGVSQEACAEMTADVRVYDVLQRFFHIRLFTRLSRLVGAQVLLLTRHRPPDYQPELCTDTSLVYPDDWPLASARVGRFAAQ